MTLRADGINPRTGMVVAICSVFLVFGFMFTVSGMKGEKLGRIPLLALGPAICLPGVVAIVVANKTQGCTKWPFWQWRRPRKQRGVPASGEDTMSTTTVGESSRLIRDVEQGKLLRYLRDFYPTRGFRATREISDYCALEQLGAPGEGRDYASGSGSVGHVTRDSVVVLSPRDGAPSTYASYCCGDDPTDFRMSHETMV
ncbi:transmembrane protein 215-like [Conger conger]|uniref:transmembrane protein 215-like n=1 Tax=Conger conger TaxID=82655 RepID=UPI002A5AF5C9|nr:transmembrane protein 215-like [Conger conger]